MCSLDLEPCDAWNERAVKARKPHRCDACDTLIPAGAHYLRHFHIFEDSLGTERMCADCWMVREAFAEAHGQNFFPSMLIDQLRQCVGDNDDEEDEWRPLLASVLKRYRVSRAGEQSKQVPEGG